MADNRTPAERRKNMQAVKSKGSAAEMKVRKLCHRLGYRFRLHRKDLPGTPDLVFPKRKLCIFVHGCFWHQHPGCKKATIPQTNTAFWKTKLEKNVVRDKEVVEKLKEMGWNVAVIWECETKDAEKLQGIVEEIFNGR